MEKDFKVGDVIWFKSYYGPGIAYALVIKREARSLYGSHADEVMNLFVLSGDGYRTKTILIHHLVNHPTWNLLK